jgi:hypothetical protein
MVGDTFHLPCKVGGLRSLESKMNLKGLYTGFYFFPAILYNFVMMGDTLHLPCKVGGLCSLESKMNSKDEI